MRLKLSLDLHPGPAPRPSWPITLSNLAPTDTIFHMSRLGIESGISDLTAFTNMLYPIDSAVGGLREVGQRGMGVGREAEV